MSDLPKIFSIPDFCRAHAISRSSLYKLWKVGEGPATCKVGRRTVIAAEAAEEWRQWLAVAGAPLASGEVSELVTKLSEQALPRLIEIYGAGAGTALYLRRWATLFEALGLGEAPSSQPSLGLGEVA